MTDLDDCEALVLAWLIDHPGTSKAEARMAQFAGGDFPLDAVACEFPGHIFDRLAALGLIEQHAPTEWEDYCQRYPRAISDIDHATTQHARKWWPT